MPPDSTLGLERSVQILHRRSGAKVTRLLPALRMFKIGVKFNISGEREATARDEETMLHSPVAPLELTARDKEVIRVLQQDLPVTQRPFDDWRDRRVAALKRCSNRRDDFVISVRCGVSAP